ncbi:MAG: type I-E CRISPR-associated protein Cas7/Cse4/CasC [Chloroflexi bacterium]|nr:type I-E CRISPR-associated protein Cas7/Cse4/CasC [Chloroflexota bacterium]
MTTPSLIEVHVIQNFPPSNLNRDDTGSPKDCEFGGYRRARVSSQSLKRATRVHFQRLGFLTDADRGQRTKRIVEWATDRVATHGGHSHDEAVRVVETALAIAGYGFAEPGAGDPYAKTEYLLYVGQDEVSRLTDICLTHWADLAAQAGILNPPGTPKAKLKAAGSAAAKGGAKALAAELATVLTSRARAADVALFGRMLADRPDANVDAAAQVAHAISTNVVSVEFDYYTAVDDRKPGDTAGADMIGTVEFNAPCFYRYANVDVAQLHTTIGGDDALVARAVAAFLEATVAAVPSGKQNSMAAYTPPSFVLAVARDGTRWNLANAFARPVAPTRDHDLVEGSVARLCTHWDALTGMYGTRGIAGTWSASLVPIPGNAFGAGHHAGTVTDLVRGALAACGLPAIGGA